VSAEDDDDFLLPHEVAARLHVSPKTVTRWADAGLIPCVVTLGGHRRFRRQEVDAIVVRMQQRAARS
jgi:excisionase family DNA binding protein